MRDFGKGLFAYTVQVVVALVVGGVVGSLVAIGIVWLIKGEVTPTVTFTSILSAIGATSSTIIVLTAIGVLPVKGK